MSWTKATIDTPRTDAAEKRMSPDNYHAFMQMLFHARDLERELASMREHFRREVEKAWKEGSGYGRCDCRACSEYDTAKWLNSRARRIAEGEIQ